MTELPTTFGKYYLTEKLATGGMAQIFLGKLIGPGGFEKALVIKQIHPALSDERRFVDLFVAEAKILVSLTHGNIVPVYELGVVDDTYFIAMEYIDGPTLYQLTEARFATGGALAPALAGWIVGEIARGLDYAHRKGAGVVHRDLSPRNVMLSREGEVKIVDFGIAVGHGAGDDVRGPGDDGMPTGSFAYMSPEQVARRPLTGQSDLFSLGVLAWEMLVGERLFARPTPEDTLAAVREAPIPPPSSRRPEVPARLDELVLRALERDPARRWGSAAELLAPLQRYLFSLEPTPGPRDVAALVATTCPPRARRARTEAGERTPAGAPAPLPAGDAGPSTRPLPERRRRRPSTVREASFATHVDIERALGKTPPPAAAVAPADEPTTRAVPRPAADEPTTRAAPRPTADEPTTQAAPRSVSGTAARATAAPPARADSARAAAALAATATSAGRWRRPALAAAAMAAVAAALALLGPCRERRATTAPPVDAAAVPPLDAAVDTAVDAPPPVDAATDASVPLDAAVRDPVPPRRDDARRPETTGTLKVGANPWGEVYLDGRALGRAPHAWPVPAGKHVLEVVFPAEDGEVRRRIPVTVEPGKEARVFVDFTGS